MSEASNGDGAAGSVNDLDLPQNKKESEKNRREQENLCIEELAMLISAQIPELSDSDDSSSTTDAGSRLEKGSILQDTVDKLKSLRAQLKVRLFDDKDNIKVIKLVNLYFQRCATFSRKKFLPHSLFFQKRFSGHSSLKPSMGLCSL